MIDHDDHGNRSGLSDTAIDLRPLSALEDDVVIDLRPQAAPEDDAETRMLYLTLRQRQRDPVERMLALMPRRSSGYQRYRQGDALANTRRTGFIVGDPDHGVTQVDEGSRHTLQAP